MLLVLAAWLNVFSCGKLENSCLTHVNGPTTAGAAAREEADLDRGRWGCLREKRLWQDSQRGGGAQRGEVKEGQGSKEGRKRGRMEKRRFSGMAANWCESETEWIRLRIRKRVNSLAARADRVSSADTLVTGRNERWELPEVTEKSAEKKNWTYKYDPDVSMTAWLQHRAAQLVRLTVAKLSFPKSGIYLTCCQWRPNWALIWFLLSHCSIEKETLKAFLFDVYYSAADKARAAPGGGEGFRDRKSMYLIVGHASTWAIYSAGSGRQ